jgi:hypothetical protein
MCKLFNLLLLNLIQLSCNWHDNGIILKTITLIFGSQKYLGLHPSQVSISQTIFLYQRSLDISENNMVAEKKHKVIYTKLITYTIYNMG